jgi:hypothetical protein
MVHRRNALILVMIHISPPRPKRLRSATRPDHALSGFTGSPFAARSAAELAERRERNAPHGSIPVRWGIGAITVDGDQATVVTQETWRNQKVNAVAPEQATVRVACTLRWDAAARRWLIVESEQMLLLCGWYNTENLILGMHCRLLLNVVAGERC